MFRVMFVVAVGCLSACSNGESDNKGCVSDFDCPSFSACNVATGICLCNDDNACDGTEFCNLAGRCQALSECLSNSDCRNAENPAGMCDSITGQCVTLSPALQCTLDSHCAFGTICQGSICAPGCRDDGDCALGDPCINSQCDRRPGACTSNAFCRVGDVCNLTSLTCFAHRERNLLCQRCDPRDVFNNDCPERCLIDSTIAPIACTNSNQCDPGGVCEPGQCGTDDDCAAGTCEDIFFGIGTCSQSICRGYYCGASECSDADPCPNGYGCSALQLVSNVSCDFNNPNSCGANRSCNGGGENGNVGFCSCGADSDCPQNGLDPVACVNPGPFGSCVIGTTCGPADGQVCADLLNLAEEPQP